MSELEELATADRRDHMRGTLELIAGNGHRISATGAEHYVEGDVALVPVNFHDVRKARGAAVETRLLPVHRSKVDEPATAVFEPDTCPVCMARWSLEQIDAAEDKELTT